MTPSRLVCLILPALLFFAFASSSRGDAAAQARIDALSEQIAAAPAEPALLLRRASVYAETNDLQQALVDVNRAAALGDPVDSAYMHGVLLYKLGDFPGARARFDDYLLAYPQHRGALDYRARLLRDMNEGAAALADYQLLFSLNDALDPGYYLAAARLMADSPTHSTGDALALLDSRMAQVGVLSALQRYAIQLDVSRGNFDAAMQRMATLDQKLRATAHWQVDMAELLLLDGRPEEALAYLDVAGEQLDKARPTVARQAVRDKAAALREQAESTVKQ